MRVARVAADPAHGSGVTGAWGWDEGAAPEIRALVEQFPPQVFRRGEILVHNTRHQPSPPGTGSLAYILEGLVRGAWNAPFIAPANRATTIIAGDGRWVGADAFKYGANLFRYDALTLTTASIVPLEFLCDRAPRAVLIDALRCVSLDWCTSASVMSFESDTLERRLMLLLYNLFRLHPRPEIEVRQQDVAELLGVARQTLHPVLKRLTRAGLLDVGYGDADALLAELRAPSGRLPAPRTAKPRAPARRRAPRR